MEWDQLGGPYPLPTLGLTGTPSCGAVHDVATGGCVTGGRVLGGLTGGGTPRPPKIGPEAGLRSGGRGSFGTGADGPSPPITGRSTSSRTIGGASAATVARVFVPPRSPVVAPAIQTPAARMTAPPIVPMRAERPFRTLTGSTRTGRAPPNTLTGRSTPERRRSSSTERSTETGSADGWTRTTTSSFVMEQARTWGRERISCSSHPPFTNVTVPSTAHGVTYDA